MKPYYGRFVSGDSQGVDAFSVSWRMGRGFFHPPVGLVSRGIGKAGRERAEGEEGGLGEKEELRDGAEVQVLWWLGVGTHQLN